VKVLPYLDAIVSQAEFAQMIGVSEASVSKRVSDGVLTRGESVHAWLIAYCEHLRDQAAGRLGETLGLDLVQERAGLARAQREAQELKNAVARGEYAPIGILADVLALASSAIVDRLDQLEGQLRKACPDLPEDARQVVLRLIADSRNEWIRATSQLVNKEVEAMALADADETATLDISAGTDEEGDAR
jgi:phage terminase Nu1 subunit (DNA packaging protein)